MMSAIPVALTLVSLLQIALSARMTTFEDVREKSSKLPRRGHPLFAIWACGEWRVKGDYAVAGYHAGRPTYARTNDKNVKIYYSNKRKAWRLVIDTTFTGSGRTTLYHAMTDDMTLPMFGWEAVAGAAPAPQIVNLVRPNATLEGFTPRPAADCRKFGFPWYYVVGSNRCDPFAEIECGVTEWCGLPGFKRAIKACVLLTNENERACKTFSGTIQQLADYSTPHLLRAIDIEPSKNSFSSGSAQLPALLLASPEVQELDLTKANIGFSDVLALTNSLLRLRKLHTLQICFDDITEKGAKTIAGIVPLLPALERLGNRGQMNEYVVETLVTAFRAPTTFTSFKPATEFDPLDDADAAALAPWIGLVTGLQNLDLSGNSFGDDGVKAMAAAITKLSQLRTLSLRGIALGTTAAYNLASGLKTLVALQELDLTETGIGRHGLTILAPVLGAHQPTFKKLKLTPDDLVGCSSEAGKIKLVNMLADLSEHTLPDLEILFACTG